MKFNFRKVVPVITGALLLGSTIGFATGVAGQDATYPSSFADSVVVIGAASADSAAANELAADLGKLTVSGETSVSDGHLIQKGSNVLEYNEDFQDIDYKLDDSDLPALLADGVYKDTKGNNDNEEEYSQYLEFINGGNKLVYEANEDNDDKRAAFLKLTDNVVAYNYTVDFSTGPTYDNTSTTTLKNDFELTKLNMLGDEWTITDATTATLANGPTKFTMMGGATASTMKTGEAKTLVMGGKSYDIEVVVYSDKAQFTINGESLTIDESSTDEISDGTEIGVTEISTSSKETVADQVEFFLGARKLVLEDGQEVELNGEDVDGSKVYITNTASRRLSEISITYAPEDDVWRGVGESWKDPVFGKFKFVFAALQQVGEEEITLSTGADNGKLTVLNSAGKELEIELYDNESDVYLGEKFSRANLTVSGRSGIAGSQGNLLVENGDFCVGATIEKCEGIELLVVDSQGEARIYELSDVSTSNEKLKFTDKTSNKEYEMDYTNGTATNYDIGLIGDLTVTINHTANYTYDGNVGTFGVLNFTNFNQWTAGYGFETSLEGNMKLEHEGQNVEMHLRNKTGVIKSWNLTAAATTNNDMEISISGLAEEESGDDYHVGIDNANYGAWFRWDSEDKDDMEITYPGDERAWADMYVAPLAAVVSGGGLVPVVRDSELGDLKTSKDLVVVGGPAVNKLAAELLDLTFPTYGDDTEMFAADSAMIKLFEGKVTPGKVALLVAGYEAKDTSAAAKALIAENQFGDLTTTTASTYSFA